MARILRQQATGPEEGAEDRSEAPRWSQIADDLAASIGNGRWASGATLPSAAAVAAEYGVHRHTARQAFKHLQDLGLVSVERGRGTIVTGRRFPYRIGRRVSLRANFGAAGVEVQGEIVSSAEGQASSEIAALLGIAAGEPVWQIRTLNRAAGMPVSTGLHTLAVSRFPRFDERLAAARASITAAFAGYGIRDYVRLSTRLSARNAEPFEAELLDLPPQSPVMQSVGLDGLSDGTPLQTIEGAFAGERVEFVVAPEA